MKDVKSLQDLIDAEFARPLHDTSTPFDRLRELTQRGIDGHLRREMRCARGGSTIRKATTDHPSQPRQILPKGFATPCRISGAARLNLVRLPQVSGRPVRRCGVLRAAYAACRG